MKMDSAIIVAIIGFCGTILSAIIGKTSNSKKTRQRSGNGGKPGSWVFVISIAAFVLSASTFVVSLLIYFQGKRDDGVESTPTTGIVIDESTASAETTEYTPVSTAPTEPEETEYTPPYILPGTTKTFGHYEQDDKDLNGAETIKWIALAQNDDKVLVISDSGLEVFPYYKGEGDSSDWENSSIRSWLNGTFYQTAFSAEEKEHIIQETIVQHKNKAYPNCEQGDDTPDYVFLLSLEEYTEYIYNSGNLDVKDRYGKPSTYVAEHHKDIITDELYWWWLRTSSRYNTTACAVTGYGEIDYGFESISANGLIRPAMWVNADWWDSL